MAGICLALPTYCAEGLVCDVSMGCVDVDDPLPGSDAGLFTDASVPDANRTDGDDSGRGEAGVDSSVRFPCTPRAPLLVVGPSVGTRLPVAAREGRYWLGTTESTTRSRWLELDRNGVVVREASIDTANAADIAVRNDEVVFLTHSGSRAEVHRFDARSGSPVGARTTWNVGAPAIAGLVATSTGFEYAFDDAGTYTLLRADSTGREVARFSLGTGDTWYRLRSTPFGSLASARNGACWAAFVQPEGELRMRVDFPASTRCFDNAAALNSELLAGAWHESNGGREVFVAFFERSTGLTTLPRTRVSPSGGQHAGADLVEEGAGFRVVWTDRSTSTHAIGTRHIGSDGRLGPVEMLPLEAGQQVARLRVLRNGEDTGVFWHVDGVGTYFAAVCE